VRRKALPLHPEQWARASPCPVEVSLSRPRLLPHDQTGGTAGISKASWSPRLSIHGRRFTDPSVEAATRTPAIGTAQMRPGPDWGAPPPPPP
jgi:hypothetical protein